MTVIVRLRIIYTLASNVFLSDSEMYLLLASLQKQVHNEISPANIRTVTKILNWSIHEFLTIFDFFQTAMCYLCTLVIKQCLFSYKSTVSKNAC